jgi:hypothetical protein
MKEKTIITERTDGAFNKITYIWDTERNEALDIIDAEIISTEEAEAIA